MNHFVALNGNRESCIVVLYDTVQGVVHYIPMGALLEVQKASVEAFKEQGWVQYATYPVRRAAQIYRAMPAVTATAEAQRHLESLLVDPSTAYDEATFNKEYTMARAAKAVQNGESAEAVDKFNKQFAKGEGTKAKKPAAKAGTPKPTVKGATEANEKATKSPSDTKAAAAKDVKIKVLKKENPHREASGRAKAFDAMLKSKTVAEYTATGSKPKYIKDWVDSGHIQLA